MGNIANAWEESLFVLEESAYDTTPSTAYAATQCVDHEKVNFALKRERAVDATRKQTRGQLINDCPLLRKAGTFSLEKVLRPSGTAGTAPDDGLFWKSVFGTETIVGATSVTYTPLATRATSLSAYLYRGHIGQHLSGIVADSVEIIVSNRDDVKVKFDGGFADEGIVGTTTLNDSGGIDASITTVTVTDGTLFRANCRALIESEIVLVTAVSGNNLTITRAYAGTTGATHADGVAISPVSLSRTIVGTPLTGVMTTLVIGGVTYDITDCTIKYSNKQTLINDECGTAKATGWKDAAMKECTINAKIRLYKAKAGIVNKTFNDTTLACVLTITNGAGKIVTVTMSYVKGEAKEIGETDEEIIYEFNGVAYESSGNDEISVAFT